MVKTTSITCIKDGKIRLDRNALCSITLRSDIKENRIAVISIFHDGRSNNVNADILHQYFQIKKWERKQWMSEIGKSPDIDRKSDKPVIRIWDDLIMINTESGEKIGVLIMESIVALDDKEVIKEHNSVKLLTWSLLASSISIVNISRRMQKCDLENLQISMDYALAVAAKKATSLKLHSVMFLVQDWMGTNKYRFGIDGGKSYLEELSSQSETRETLKHLKSAQTEMECFLLPHRQAVDMNDPFCNNNNRDRETVFGGYVSSFGDTLLNRTKSFKDSKAPMEIFELLTSHDQLFDSPVICEPKLLLQEASKDHYENVCAQCFKKYDRTMRVRTKGVQFDEILDINREVTVNTLKEFDSSSRVGLESLRTEFRDKLANKCNNLHRQYEDTANNRMLEAEKQLTEIADREMCEYIAEIEKKLVGQISDADLDMCHQQYYLGAIKSFRSKTSTPIFERCEKLKNKFNGKMQNDIKEYYKRLKDENEKNWNMKELQKLVNDMTDQYRKRINDHSTKGVAEKSLQEEHTKICASVGSQFNDKASFAPSALVKTNKGNLNDRIRTMYFEALTENRNVARVKNKKLEELVNQMAKQFQQKINEVAKGINANELQAKYNQIRHSVLSLFNTTASSISVSDLVETHRRNPMQIIDMMYNEACTKNRNMAQTAIERNRLEQRLLQLGNHGAPEGPHLVRAVLEHTVQQGPNGVRVTRTVRRVFLPGGGIRR
uniref:atlastin-2-like isoform X2 n=1 Tax=Styela clava TaxID=7725 RepID=UPI00193ADB6C|nr:atlastin-2-like isoform X2 [Styela clava]